MVHKNLLKDFKRPKKVLFESEESNNFYGRFIASPFERGFGITIANSLRRTLLSSIPGYAVTAMRVEYVGGDGKTRLLSNEFEGIHGVDEDTLVLIQNLKQVKLKLEDGVESRTIFIEKKGLGNFEAKDFMVDEGVEVFNGSLHLAKLTEECSLFMEFQIDWGRGYVSAERNMEYIQTIGTVPIDAIYSPVERVSFHVENTRVGQQTDFDKFILEVWTDGTIAPVDAVASAAKILKEHFVSFINFDDNEEVEDDRVDPEEERLRNVLKTTIEDLELSVRSSNCLRVSGIKTVGDLVIRSQEEVNSIKNLGKKSVLELEDKLKSMGLTFGMKKSLNSLGRGERL